MTKLPTSVTQFFLHFVRKQPIAFLFLFLAPLSIILETNVIPYILKVIIDTIIDYQGNKNTIFKEIKPTLWFGSLAWLGLIVIMRLQQLLQAYVTPRFEADIRMSVFNHVMYHSYNYFSNHLSGDIANKIMDLPKSMESIRMILCWNCITTFAVVSVTLVVMATINPLFSLILGIWVITHLTITLYFVGLVNKASEKNAVNKSILSGTIVDVISNITSTKLFTTERYELSYTINKQEKEKISNSDLILTMNFFQLCTDIPVSIMLGTTFYFLIVTWQQDSISTGDFVLVFNMMFSVMYLLWHLGNALSELFHAIGVARQALTLIISEHQVTDIPDAKPICITQGEISFNNVTFYYNKGQNIFENINIVIKPGQKVGLVGFSGSGKTTFANLILRFFDVKSGTIAIDGQDITKVTQDSLRKNIAMIPQDTALFHRTLIENICYGQTNASNKEMLKASKKAYCHDFITKLQNQYNSLVGERGIKLSGGQRQRITIARAILKDPTILILDEATSALDSLTEEHIQKSLNQLMKNCTTIVIAHRISTLSAMDRILVFDKGRIIEDGTHEELLKAQGHYTLLWKMQVGNFLPQKRNP